MLLKGQVMLSEAGNLDGKYEQEYWSREWLWKMLGFRINMQTLMINNLFI